MSPVILIGSCEEYRTRGFHEAIRATWGRGSVIPYFFILGEGGHSERPDEVVLQGVGDDYKSIAFKTREGHRWARQQGHDFVFQAWADTYCFTKRMIRSGFENCDYVGHFRGETVHQLGKIALGCYASGGSGYWMSPRFTDLLIQEEPDHWAEDLWVGRVSKKFGIAGTQDYRYFSAGGYAPECLTIHLSRGTGRYDPAWMGDTYFHAMKRGEL